MPLRRVVVAVAAGVRTDGVALDQAPRGDEADLEQLLAAGLLAASQSREVGRCHPPVLLTGLAFGLR